MSLYENIKENLTTQIYELEALQSVYPKELVVADHGTLADINSFIESPQEDLPQRLEYTINISENEVRLTMFNLYYAIRVLSSSKYVYQLIIHKKGLKCMLEHLY